MELHRRDTAPAVDEALDRPVVEVAMADPVACDLERGAVDDLNLMVVRADVDPARHLLEHRVVAAVVPDSEPMRRGARGEGKELVAETDAQDRSRPADRILGELADDADLDRHPRWVTGPRREHDEVGVRGAHILGGGRWGQSGDLHAA